MKIKNTAPPLAGMNYDLMFGSPSASVVDRWKVIPDILPMQMEEARIRKAVEHARRSGQWLLLFVIGTKPCFYKFWGSIAAAREARVPYLVIDSGQHYDPLLTHGTREFGYRDEIAINLNIRGDLAQKTGELLFKTSWLARYFGQKWPDVPVVPVVLGDTIMTSIVPAAWLFCRNEKAIQNEAGLRSMSPVILRRLAGDKSLNLDTFFQGQRQGGWERMTQEPFPEQYDTFTSAAGSQFLFAPTELNRRHLLQEGYPDDRIFVIGGVVVDALELKLKQKPARSIFQEYPALQKHRWLRVDVHRKENLTPRRFAAIIGGIKLLVRKGYYVNFIEMNATRTALQHYGLQSEIDRLRKKKNFLYTPIWPEYSQVIEFYKSPSLLAALTDSGGLQEELNMLRKPCFTCRFNTDRPETVQQGKGNFLIPPVNAEFVARAVDYAVGSPRLYDSMLEARPLYGRHVGAQFIAHLKRFMREKRRPFEWAHERLGFWKENAKRTPFL